MPKRIPSFPLFKKEIFDKINEEEKNVLFYWSLIDASTWEDYPSPSYYPDFLRGKRRVLSLLKRSNFIKKNYFTSGLNKEKFYKNFVQSEFLTNYLLAAQIERKIKAKIKGEIDKVNLGKADFPDVRIKNTKAGIVNIEIKGILSAGSLKNRVTDEIIPKIKGYKKKYRNLLLLLLFLVCPSENSDRVQQLIGGYYLYEELMKDAMRETKEARCKALCQCFPEKYLKKYSLEKLTEKIYSFLTFCKN